MSFSLHGEYNPLVWEFLRSLYKHGFNFPEGLPVFFLGQIVECFYSRDDIFLLTLPISNEGSPSRVEVYQDTHRLRTPECGQSDLYTKLLSSDRAGTNRPLAFSQSLQGRGV
jgi:hypothetical protein